MEIIINKKGLDLPSITKAGIETAGEANSVLVTAETSLLGGLRYEIPCTIKQEGEVMFYSQDISKAFSVLKDEITIKSTTTNVYISDGDITFKEKRLTGEAAYFPKYEDINVNTVDLDALLSALNVAMPSSDYRGPLLSRTWGLPSRVCRPTHLIMSAIPSIIVL